VSLGFESCAISSIAEMLSINECEAAQHDSVKKEQTDSRSRSALYGVKKFLDVQYRVQGIRIQKKSTNELALKKRLRHCKRATPSEKVDFILVKDAARGGYKDRQVDSRVVSPELPAIDIDHRRG
jgi:hypothetical protein